MSDMKLRSKDWFIVGLIRSEQSVSKQFSLVPNITKTENSSINKLESYTLKKSPQKANRITGIYKSLRFDSIRDLGKFIQEEATDKDVFVSGLAGYDEVSCYNPSSKHMAIQRGDLSEKYILRNDNYIKFLDVPGILCIDIDFKNIDSVKSIKDCYKELISAVPELKDAPAMGKGSTSSCIKYKGNTKIVDKDNNILSSVNSDKPHNLNKIGGVRLYFVISTIKFLEKQSNICKIQEILKTRLWNSGTGFVDFTADGKFDFKCLVDLKVYGSSSRLDFIKAGIDETSRYNGLYQEFDPFVYWNEKKEPLDVGIFKGFLTIKEIHNYKDSIEKEKKSLHNLTLQKKIKKQYEKKLQDSFEKREEKRLGKQLTNKQKNEIKHNISSSIRKIRNNREIDEFYPIYLWNKEKSKVEIVSIREIYENGLTWKNKYNGLTCASILDPYYSPGKLYNGLNEEHDIIESNGAGVDFGRARIWCDDTHFYIIDQSHGGIKFEFDISWLDIEAMKIKRLDTNELIIPKYNLTKIANCFINQYAITDDNDIKNFGNVLWNLNHPYSKDVFIIMIKSNENKELGESGESGEFGIEPEQNNSEQIWDKLDGIGPTLFEFMSLNEQDKDKVDLNNEKLLKVNKLDVKHKCNLLRMTYTKIMYSTKCLYAKKKYNEFEGWYYDFIEEGELKKFLKAHKIYQYNQNAKESTKLIKLFDFWDDVELVSFSEIEFKPVKGVIACKQDTIKASKESGFNTYCGLNIVPEKKTYDLISYEKEEKISVTEYGKETKTTIRKQDEKGNKKQIIKKVQGDHLLKEHIYEIICNRNEDQYEYLLNWYARMLQYPNEQGGSVLAFQGAQGAGKNTLTNVFCKILGKNALDIANGNLIFGNFNNILADKIYVNFNEAIFSGDKKGQGQFKTLTTEDHIVINRKNKDELKIKNTLHLSLVSNHEALAPIDPGDRRIAVYDVSSKMLGKKNNWYFDNLYNEMNNGGVEHFASDLLNRNLDKFRISELPKEHSSASAVVSTLDFGNIIYKWWYECLLDNSLFGFSSGPLTESKTLVDLMLLGSFGAIPTKILHESYINYMHQLNRKNMLSQIAFSRLLMRVAYDKKVVKWGEGDKKAHNCLVFEGLEMGRERFSKFLNQKVSWE